ncbi:hypothetical protein D9M69_402030 [compost metagenome]
MASSQSRIFGPVASARAMPTRCFWPPESCAGYLLACSLRPTRASSSATRAAICSRLWLPASFSGRATLSATVFDDSRLKCWKIIPTCWRKRRRPSVSRAVTSSPSMTMRPPEGSSRRLIRRSRVLLPAPEWPIRPNTSPAATDSSVGCSAGMLRPLTRYALWTRSNSITGTDLLGSRVVSESSGGWPKARILARRLMQS